MSRLRHRLIGAYSRSLIALIQDNKYQTVAEVGVFQCINATAVLSRCVQQLDAYYLIDPWQPYGVKGMAYVDWEELHRFALWLKAQCPVVQVWRLPSVDAAKLFQPKSLDLVFIDGNHSYQAVRDDIEAWLPIVREGGILAGHDYCQLDPGVVQAVDELLEGVQFLPDTIWYIKKP